MLRNVAQVGRALLREAQVAVVGEHRVDVRLVARAAETVVGKDYYRCLAVDLLHYVSQKLRADSVHISTYQAISRAKDPEAKNRSIAIMIGARKEEVEKCLLWGPSRTLKPLRTEKGLKFDVEIQDPIGKPLLTVAP